MRFLKLFSENSEKIDPSSTTSITVPSIIINPEIGQTAFGIIPVSNSFQSSDFSQPSTFDQSSNVVSTAFGLVFQDNSNNNGLTNSATNNIFNSGSSSNVVSTAFGLVFQDNNSNNNNPSFPSSNNNFINQGNNEISSNGFSGLIPFNGDTLSNYYLNFFPINGIGTSGTNNDFDSTISVPNFSNDGDLFSGIFSNFFNVFNLNNQTPESFNSVIDKSNLPLQFRSNIKESFRSRMKMKGNGKSEPKSSKKAKINTIKPKRKKVKISKGCLKLCNGKKSCMAKKCKKVKRRKISSNENSIKAKKGNFKIIDALKESKYKTSKIDSNFKKASISNKNINSKVITENNINKQNEKPSFKTKKQKRIKKLRKVKKKKNDVKLSKTSKPKIKKRRKVLNKKKVYKVPAKKPNVKVKYTSIKIPKT